MSKLPRISGKKLITVLEKVGVKVTRTKGSHFVLRHIDGKVRVIPDHLMKIWGFEY
ncbi:MAG: hypothetical protein FD143_3188 [Ignavibacteria bacterium]|nr:MAG: hypothetical protein FD143_3188 [Ignavibacteria bacterium]KAF0154071.1 MAG: hypothetical protein FD188_3302 [Ignavibacteria bacterium]